MADVRTFVLGTKLVSATKTRSLKEHCEDGGTSKVLNSKDNATRRHSTEGHVVVFRYAKLGNKNILRKNFCIKL